MAARRIALATASLVVLVACDDAKPKPAAEPEKPAAAPPSAAPPATLPNFQVDASGISFAGGRYDTSTADKARELTAALAALPLKQRPATVAAARAARAETVGALVRALEAVGASKVSVVTPGRANVKGPLELTLASSVAAPPDCAVVASVRKDNTSAVWHLRGGTAVKFAKGFSGPDLSTTFDGIEREAKSCASSTWFFAGEEGTLWGPVFDLGASVAMPEKPSKLTTHVLLTEAPVAGRPVSPSPPRAAAP